MQMSSDKKDSKIIQKNISAAFQSKKNVSAGNMTVQIMAVQMTKDKSFA